MKTLVLNLGTMDADAVLCGGQSAILRRIMPAGCQPGMRVIFHHNGFMVGEAVIAAAYTGTAEEYNAAQLALAKDLLAQLRTAGADAALFDELMMAHSEASDLAANPDGYVFDASANLVPGFREATLELDVGELSDIVETDYGYHILLRLPVDGAEYADGWVSQEMNAHLDAVAATAEVVEDGAIAELDIASFYDRYCAYYNELYAQLNPTTEG